MSYLNAIDALEALIKHAQRPGMKPERNTVVRLARKALRELDTPRDYDIAPVGTDGATSAWPGVLRKAA